MIYVCINRKILRALAIPRLNPRWKVWTSTEQEMKINDVMIFKFSSHNSATPPAMTKYGQIEEVRRSEARVVQDGGNTCVFSNVICCYIPSMNVY